MYSLLGGGKKTPGSPDKKKEVTTPGKASSRQKSTKKEASEAGEVEINEEDYIPVEKKAEIGKRCSNRLYNPK